MSSSVRRLVWLTLLLSACDRRFEAPLAEAPAREAEGKAVAASGFVSPASADMAATVSETPGSRPDTWRDPAVTGAMLIRTGQASIQVDSLDAAVARLSAIVRGLGGRVAGSSQQGGEVGYRSATLELRLPAEQFEALLPGLRPLGRLESLNVQAEDVGEEFTDVSARVTNAHRLEQRLLELLATRTGKLSDVLELERELARVREEIERMEGRLRYLRAHVATSTLTVTLHEPAPVVGQSGALREISDAFRDAWRNLVHFVAGLIASMGVLLPAGVLLVLTALGLRRLWRGRRARLA